MITVLESIREDCEILLTRAFFDKNLTFFGEDGAGKHGKSNYPVTGHVISVVVEADADDPDSPSTVAGIVTLTMLGYNSTVIGHAITDHNLRIALDICLKDADIDPAAVEWAGEDLQGENSITLFINIEMLLDW
jgi:hypothetical protein